MQKFRLFSVVMLGATLIGYKGTVSMSYADDDTFVKIQEMVNDLGGPAKQKANNGKKLACVNGGYKRITIKSSGDGTTYKGVYKNCHEYGQTRDGEVEITTGGGGGEEEAARPAKPIDRALDAMLDNDFEGLAKILKKNKKLINTGITVNNSGGGETKGWTLLMAAAQNGSLDAVKFLIKAGANVNAINSKSVNALWMAANKGNTDVVKYLISKGSKVNYQSNKGDTALIWAANLGYTDIVLALIEAKANLELKDDEGCTALIWAIAGKDPQIAITLIDAGANVNTTYGSGNSPLTEAVNSNNPVVLKRLFDAGAKTGFELALKIAQDKGNQEIIDLLTQYKPKDI